MKKTIVASLLTAGLVLGGGDLAFAETTDSSPSGTPVTLTVGAASPTSVTTGATTVGDLLAEQHVTLAGTDAVTPSLSAPITTDLQVKVDRITVTSKTANVTLLRATINRKTSSLRKGLSKLVTPAKAGLGRRTYTTTTINGVAYTVINQVVVKTPVARVVLIGTKTPAVNIARLSMWNKIAKCESGGNWKISTGNGYYGGLQFNLGTWRGAGGRTFASKPHKASKAEQITIANRIYSKRGLQPWGGCGRKATR